MNFNRARSWPHPVVSPLCDDVAPNTFGFRLDAIAEHRQWILAVEASQDDATLCKYVREGKAQYLLHVECKRTYYRATTTSSEPIFEMAITGDALFGVVEVSLLVVATRDIKSYRHPGQHPDYRNSAFEITAGEPLAVAETERFEAFLEVDPILNLSSILDIQRDLTLSLMEVDCSSGNRIIVKLPSVEYDRYRELRAAPEIRGLLTTAVILPALLDAFFHLRGPDIDIDEFKADHLWARCVLNRLDQKHIDILSDESSGTCLRAAQTLLRTPMDRMLKDLMGLLSR